MADPTSGSRAAPAAFAWGLRTYAWLVLLLVLQAVALAPLIQGLSSVQYEARALVVARQLQINPPALPRFGLAVFEGGGVARAVVADDAIGGDPEDLIPGRLEAVTPQDSVLFEIVGKDADPVLAARIANVAALAFVAELNRPGTGVGSFGVQSPAIVPTEPATKPTPLSTVVVVGVLAGGLFALGLIVVIITVRRPVVDPEDTELELGIPVLAKVTVPRFRRGQFFGPRGVPGLATVARAVVAARGPELYVASPRGAAAVRQRISVMLALAVHEKRPIAVRGCVETQMTVDDVLGSARTKHSAAHDGPAGGRLTLVDGAEPLDVLQGSGQALLVVPEGTPRERLRRLAAEYLHDELCGIVIVRVARQRSLPEVTAVDPAPIPQTDPITPRDGSGRPQLPRQANGRVAEVGVGSPHDRDGGEDGT